ncbi:hypothetical protein JJD41_09055 [Oxynema sp. CENA135]|uniref:hypothetical protein n=1 Tax=Oxynema sp. CENA135 TaxID=984206 RepID=UPI00190E5600|nr:hypothetical protein [Oxynema sp. CENA135]MBK4730003.1 hypothetical protein [Oxynema sp. CENA135]
MTGTLINKGSQLHRRRDRAIAFGNRRHCDRFWQSLLGEEALKLNPEGNAPIAIGSLKS